MRVDEIGELLEMQMLRHGRLEKYSSDMSVIIESLYFVDEVDSFYICGESVYLALYPDFFAGFLLVAHIQLTGWIFSYEEYRELERLLVR